MSRNRTAEPKGAEFQNQLYMRVRIKTQTQCADPGRGFARTFNLNKFRSRKSEAASLAPRCSQPDLDTPTPRRSEARPRLMRLFLCSPSGDFAKMPGGSWLSRSLAVTTILLSFAAHSHTQSIRLSDSQAVRIGTKIWQNESGGTVAGLTAWNYGEDFASLGIGHFIWYPAGQRGPFEESFPPLLRYLERNEVKIPIWLLNSESCPWPNRSRFLADRRSPRMEELRSLLAHTVSLQAKFAAARLEAALPKMLDAAPEKERDKIRKNFYRVAAEPLGPYALVDYVNFKGEGTLKSERYQGEGWGLLQVLESMGDGSALPEFRRAAEVVLTRRVKNSPPERGESRWLPGWKNRISTYTE